MECEFQKGVRLYSVEMVESAIAKTELRMPYSTMVSGMQNSLRTSRRQFVAL